MKARWGVVAICGLSLALALGLAEVATASTSESGYASGLLVHYGAQRLQPRQVGGCPAPGVGMPCLGSELPLRFRRRLLLDDDGDAIVLRSDEIVPNPTAGMETRGGRPLGRLLRVVPLDHGRRLVDGPVRPGGPVRRYTGHRLWRVELPRRLPRRLYMIIGTFSYPLGGFSSFAFGATARSEPA